MSIEFPPRKIQIINADVEVEVEISDQEYERLMQVFQEQEMDPIIRLTVKGKSGGKAEFTHLRLENWDERLEFVS